MWQLGRRVLWDSLPVLPAGGAQHQHSTEQLRQSAIWGSASANRAGDNTPDVTQVKPEAVTAPIGILHRNRANDVSSPLFSTLATGRSTS